ncbi:hypothetical protein BASA81_000536 [Batrachochytrium salamandrivorans]|nr:hypothetical protein BASA81_000536 [Batrachochytrium salamandrivorans]
MQQQQPGRSVEERFGESCLIPNEWGEIDFNNTLQFFAVSQFYDKRSNNTLLERQHKSLDCLVQLRGLEFSLVPPSSTPPPPDLFVIVKQIRLDEHTATAKALFYLHQRVIYQSPSVREVCLKRIRSASENLSQVVEQCPTQQPQQQPQQQQGTRGKKMAWAKKARMDFQLVERSLLGALKRLE